MVNKQDFKQGKVQYISLRPLSDEIDLYRNLFWSLEQTIQEINSNDSTVVVLIELSDVKLKPNTIDIGYQSRSLGDLLASIRFPTIGVVASEAHLVILELFLSCDIRVASKSSRFSMSHVLEGFTPLDGGTQRLPRIAGVGRAMDLLLTGRLFSAEEAMDIGVVQYLFSEDVIEEAISLASLIADHGPVAAQYFKEAILKGSDMTLSQGLRLETDLNVILQSTRDRAEGIKSFHDKKPPRFLGQ